MYLVCQVLLNSGSWMLFDLSNNTPHSSDVSVFQIHRNGTRFKGKVKNHLVGRGYQSVTMKDTFRGEESAAPWTCLLLIQ